LELAIVRRALAILSAEQIKNCPLSNVLQPYPEFGSFLRFALSLSQLLANPGFMAAVIGRDE
jgi:hypothetical protein